MNELYRLYCKNETNVKHGKKKTAPRPEITSTGTGSSAGKLYKMLFIGHRDESYAPIGG